MPECSTLTLARVEPSESWGTAGGSGRGESAPGYHLVRLLTWSGMRVDEAALLFFKIVMALPRFLLRRMPPRMQARALAARAAVERQPLYRWPGILLAFRRTGAPTFTESE
jgi:hypothetical protein